MAVYSIGSARTEKGSVTVQGVGTGWQIALAIGGLFLKGGLAVPIVAVDGDTDLTLAYPWPGDTGSGTYAIDLARAEAASAIAVNRRLTELLAHLENLRGQPGLRGARGPVTITVGDTETSDPGQPAQVTNVGTPDDLVLEFRVPVGPQGELSPEDRAYFNAAASAATVAASSATEAASQSEQDRSATAADRIQTGEDRTATAADRIKTAEDRDAIAGAAEATAADRVQTAEDRAKTTQDAAATAGDRQQTGLDRTATGQDRDATAADRLATGQDAIATAADRVKIGQDRAVSTSAAEAAAGDRLQAGQYLAAIGGAADATAADRAQTGLDRTATGQHAAATAADRIATGQDAAATAEDREQTGQDRLATGQDKIATAADRAQTGLDRVAIAGAVDATAADRVQTGQDRAAAAASAQQASETAALVNPGAIDARFNAVEGDVDALQGLIGGKADQSALEALGSSQATALALKAPLAGPVFTDIPRAPTPAAGNNSDQVATTAFVQALFNALVNGAPGFLDQFNEFAAAVGNDPNFATTILNALANKQPLDSDLTAIATLTTQAFGRALLTAADAAAVLSAIGLEQVNNTPDNLKPVSQAQQTALNLKLDARPALGAFAHTIADWNAARSNGWFMAADAANAPVGGWFLGFVEAHNDIYVTQTIHQFTADSATDSQTYRRSCNNGEWGAWAQLRITQGELDGRYLQSSAKASAAEVRAGTDDAKFATPAAIALAMAFQTINPASPDLAAAINGKVTLTATSTTFGVPTGHLPGQTGALRIQQNATGTRTASWNTFWDFGADGPPTLSTAANKIDWVFYIIDDSGTKAICSFKAAA